MDISVHAAESVPDNGVGDSNKVYSKMEFAVQMTCTACAEGVYSKLNPVAGIRSVYVDLSNEVVLVETCLLSSTVQALLEETGKLVVFRGFGGTSQGTVSPTHHGAAVVALKARGQYKGVGLVRMVQVSTDMCLIEATIDGLTDCPHEVKVHEYGDMSEGGDSCGEVISGGHLGSLVPDSLGRGTLHTSSTTLKVWNLIGRSVVVHEVQKDVPSKRVLSGVVARSAGLFQNSKKLCTCDGVTIWDEAKKLKQTE